LFSITRDRHGSLLGAPEEESLALQLAADLHSRPGLLGDFDPDSANLAVGIEHAPAERETEHFDLGTSMLAGGVVDEGLEGLPGNETVGPPFAERGREVALEPDRHRQVAGIVAVATPDDPEHPQARFALAART
jgi:hypothetical protein